MNAEKLSEYLLFFAKFEYALCRAGFAKCGRRINNDHTLKTWESDWEAFSKKLPSNFLNEVKEEQICSEILKNSGPQIYGKKDGENPRFHPDTPISNTETLIFACKHIRNNLIHGEKLQSDAENAQRNQNLLFEAKKILEKAITKIAQTPKHEKMGDIFRDIPF